MSETLAIIPAKGSSARIPGKNLRPLGGTPLFLWTVRAALEVPGLRVIVSTDEGPPGEEIARLALEEGAEVVRRPAELCQDPAQAPDVALHALQSYPDTEAVVMLLPTSPFRTAQHIREALALHVSAPVVAVADLAARHHHKLCITFRGDIVLGPPIRDPAMREALSPTGEHGQCEINGSIWIATAEHLRLYGHISAVGATPYYMDEQSGLDIDTETDWLVAEAILRNRALIAAGMA